MSFERNFEDCAVCGNQHRWPREPICLDCHGQLEAIGPYVYRCLQCHVKHGSGWGTFSRAGRLWNRLNGVKTDYSGQAVLSPNLRGEHEK
jgi:hypothetical protein